ncbi:transmembrane protein 179B [Paramormyrops kingsleyae]|uniref:transmembrane protein 179B n=1 Tax=Paramormyrops kingsleyae TaxID=1676925 RepID=UPI003B97825D
MRAAGCFRARAYMSEENEMALPRLVILELLLYASCFICGIVTAASLIIVQGEFAGRCMLYGTVSYNATAQSLGVDSSSPTSLCFFVTVISVFMGVYCFSLTLYWIYTCCMGEEVSRARVWMNVSLVVCGIFLFFLLVSGCILKIGRDRLCDSILRNTTIKSCEDAQTKRWISPYHGERFYSGLHSAEGAVWVNFFFWMLIFMVVMFQKYQASEFTIEEGEHVSPSESNPILGRTSRHQ